jgi:deoxyribose-phosphate aldolase
VDQVHIPDVDQVQTARRALECLDLTSLNLDDTPAVIDALCDRALTPGPGIVTRPAAVCVYPRFAAQCRGRLAGSAVVVAVVVNFPAGDGACADVVAEVQGALHHGAQEIDVVLPYRAYLAGRRVEAVEVVRAVAEVCHAQAATTKVILETGALADPAVIAAAARDAVAAGADFLKTSTGKLEPGATPEAARTLLEVIADVRGAGRTVGLKVSGGVRTVADAAVYLALTDQALSPRTADPTTFRIGASGLLNDIVRVLTGDGAGTTDRAGY